MLLQPADVAAEGIGRAAAGILPAMRRSA